MKLCLGAGETWSHARGRGFHDWIDVDIRPSTRPSVVADIRALPFAAASAEIAFCGHVLEHLPLDDVVPALRELHRVLVLGAALLVVGPDVGKGAALLAVGQTTEERFHSLQETADHKGNPALHQWDCSGQEVAWMLRKAGFRAVHEIPINETPAAFPVYDRVTADQFAVTAQR